MRPAIGTWSISSRSSVMSELLVLNCTDDRRGLDDDALLDAADRQRQVDGEVAALLDADVASARPS